MIKLTENNPWMFLLRLMHTNEIAEPSYLEVASWLEGISPCTKLRCSVHTGSGRKARSREFKFSKRGNLKGAASPSWVRVQLQDSWTRGGELHQVMVCNLYGLDSVKHEEGEIPSLQWLYYPSIPMWHGYRELASPLTSMAVRLDRVRGRMVETVLDGMRSLLPKLCASDGEVFGVAEIERAIHIAYGTEPQAGHLEIGVQRMLQQKLWCHALEETNSILPYIGWVNVLSAEMCDRAGGDMHYVFNRAQEILRTRDADHLVKVELIQLPRSGCALVVVPMHVDNVNDLYDVEYAALTDSLYYSHVLHDIYKWWRRAGVVM